MSDSKEAEPPPAPESVAGADAGDAPELPEQAPVALAPKKKRKKKRAGPPRQEGPVQRAELDAAGRERPRFLLRFPQDQSLEALIAAFEAGNYARVREDAPKLARSTERLDVKAAAEELLRRIEPDPLLKFLLGVAAALFVLVVAYVYHAHG